MQAVPELLPVLLIIQDLDAHLPLVGDAARSSATAIGDVAGPLKETTIPAQHLSGGATGQLEE